MIGALLNHHVAGSDMDHSAVIEFHADFARHLERVVKHRQKGPGNQPCPSRALRGRRQEYDRIGAIAAIAVAVMFDRADVAVAHLIGEPNQGE